MRKRKVQLSRRGAGSWRRIEIEFEGEPDLDRAREIADKLLANPVIENFEISLLEEA